MALDDAGNPIPDPVVPTPVVPAPDPGGSAWKDGLSPELKAEKSLDVFKGKDWTEVVPVMAKSYVESQRMIGGFIRLPKEDAKPEEWDSLWGKLGRPETPDKYDVKLPYPEFLEYNPEMIKSMKEVAHQHGQTNKQVQGMVNWIGEQMATEVRARKAAFTSAHDTLKAEWGGAFDRNFALAKRVRDMYGGDDAKKFFKDDPLGNDPFLIKLFAKIGSDLEEGDYLGGPGDASSVTPQEAKSKITEIMSNPKDLYHAQFQGMPGHDERVAEMKMLYEIAYNVI